ncbi:MAG: hypothetical protein QOH01_388 [Verrucomicrobiota bacterium]|jgi:hypothetical protein
MPNMNGAAPRIEIVAPFGAAFEWMKAMLFRPFDVAKWLTIAFAAFIAGSWGGGGGNFSRVGRLGDGNWKYRATKYGDWPDWNITPWIIALAIGAGLMVIILSLIWMWVSARGRFVFTDCVVKNRGAIGEPWREYRREGNSYFLFSLVIAACALVCVAVFALFAWIVLGAMHGDRESGAASVVFIVVFVLFVLAGVVVAWFIGLVCHFMVPVMYRRRCSAREAFVDVTRLVFRQPGPFILFVLFMIALTLGVIIVGTIVACMTCCIGGLPYISTVLLLPAIVWLAAFRLMFLRQFGDQYDVWSSALAPAPSPLPPSPTAPA